MDSAISFPNTYPLKSDLSGGYRFPTFEQLGPEREIKFRCYFFTFSIKRTFRHFLVVAVKKCTKKCDTRAKFWFAYLTNCFSFLDVLVAIASLDLRARLRGAGGPQVGEVTSIGGVTRLSI